MTTNQIAYNALLENKRHNIAYETETNRHNVEVESQGRQQLFETNRHNVATEANQRYAAELNYAGTIYSADRHYAATVYSADRNYAASVYATNVSRQNTIDTITSNQKLSTMRNINDRQIAYQRNQSNEAIAKLKTKTDVGHIAGGLLQTGIATAAKLFGGK